MEPCKQWGSTCSGGSPLVLGQVDPLGPPVLGSVDRGSTSPGGSTVPPTPGRFVVRAWNRPGNEAKYRLDVARRDLRDLKGRGHWAVASERSEDATKGPYLCFDISKCRIQICSCVCCLRI